MTTEPRSPEKPPSALKKGTRELVYYGLIAGSVWLAWEIVKVPVAVRSPPAIATRLAPGSPEVLRRAAEGELLAARNDNAASLAASSLAMAPFNARALRVRGLAAARAGDTFDANQMLTLAGNWSLRDDPTHAWLVDYRLRRGDYHSSFAHADTLARRRDDLQPKIFDLFTTASIHDPRALQTLVRLLAAAPPWRNAYWIYLRGREDGNALQISLAVALEQTDKPMNRRELSDLYKKWTSERRFQAVRYLRSALNRPSMSGSLLQNGDFSLAQDQEIQPFSWRYGTAAGLSVDVDHDDLRPEDQALFVTYSNRNLVTVAVQYALLDPGAYTLTWSARTEVRSGDMTLDWRVACADGGATLVMAEAIPAEASAGWRTFSARFDVPASGCPAQAVSLRTNPADRRGSVTAWVDKLVIRRNASAEPGTS